MFKSGREVLRSTGRQVTIGVGFIVVLNGCLSGGEICDESGESGGDGGEESCKSVGGNKNISLKGKIICE